MLKADFFNEKSLKKMWSLWRTKIMFPLQVHQKASLITVYKAGCYLSVKNY